MRKGWILSGGIAVSCLTLILFQVKYRVVALEAEIESVNRDIYKAEEAIHILKAEWAYRSSPVRLSHLVERHLDLRPYGAQHIESLKTHCTPAEAEKKVGAKIQYPFTEGGKVKPVGYKSVGYKPVGYKKEGRP